MKKLVIEMKPAIGIFVVLTFICGILYTGLLTGVAQAFFSEKADGSILSVTLEDGRKVKVGSEFMAQEFKEPNYFIGRPMGVSNLSPYSEEQKQLVEERTKWWQKFDPMNKKPIPMDLVTASGSGVDPNISVEAAEYQVARVAAERQLEEEEVRKIVEACTTEKFLGVVGEPAVNVLKVNLTLDGLLTSE